MRVGDRFATRDALKAAVDAYILRTTPELRAIQASHAARDSERLHRGTGRNWTVAELEKPEYSGRAPRGR